QNRLAGLNPLWVTHFQQTAAEQLSTNFANNLGVIQRTFTSGVEAHIRGDMADALVKTYIDFSNQYGTWSRKFDEYKEDFFDTNKRLFEQVSGIFFDYLSQMMYPDDPSVGAYALGSVDHLLTGISINTIYQWRGAAWASAKQRIESI